MKSSGTDCASRYVDIPDPEIPALVEGGPSWQNALPDDGSVSKVCKVIALQLALLALIPLAATLMSRGIGAG